MTSRKLIARLALPALLGCGLVVLLVLLSRVDARRQSASLPVLGSVADFSLTNQFGNAFDSATLRGSIWVADVFFTRCPGPCVRLNTNLRRLQDALGDEDETRIVSLTADAAFDTPEVLRRYAERFSADSNRWSFLTGPQPAIYRAVTEQLGLAVAENPAPERAAPQDLFVHSTRLVLVDAAGRIRGYFDGENPGVVKELQAAIRRLGLGEGTAGRGGEE